MLFPTIDYSDLPNHIRIDLEMSLSHIRLNFKQN